MTKEYSLCFLSRNSESQSIWKGYSLRFLSKWAKLVKSLYIFSKNFQTRIQIFWRKRFQEWFNLIIWSPKKKLPRTLHTLYQLRRALWKSSESSNFLKIHRRIFWAIIFQSTSDGMKYPSLLRSLVTRWDWIVLKDVNR